MQASILATKWHQHLGSATQKTIAARRQVSRFNGRAVPKTRTQSGGHELASWASKFWIATPVLGPESGPVFGTAKRKLAVKPPAHRQLRGHQLTDNCERAGNRKAVTTVDAMCVDLTLHTLGQALPMGRRCGRHLGLATVRTPLLGARAPCSKPCHCEPSPWPRTPPWTRPATARTARTPFGPYKVKCIGEGREGRKGARKGAGKGFCPRKRCSTEFVHTGRLAIKLCYESGPGNWIAELYQNSLPHHVPSLYIDR